MYREIKFQFVFKHPESGEVKISAPYSIDQILETYLEDIQDRCCHCDCTSVGESNVVECGDGCDYFLDFELFAKRQYTGLKDKNGTEIYEGDVCNSIYFKNSIVDFWNNGWHFNVDGCHHTFNTAAYSFEIIGNIYQNPELLKEGLAWC